MLIMEAAPSTLTEAELAVRLQSLLGGIDLDDLAHIQAAAQINAAASFLAVGPGTETAVPPSADVVGDTRRLLVDLEALPAAARRAAPVSAVLTRVRFAAEQLGVR